MADLQTTHDPGTNHSLAPLLTGIVTSPVTRQIFGVGSE